MSAPTISSRVPVVDETNVYINQLITVVFDQNIDSTTLTDNTIILYRVSDYVMLDKDISYDSSTYTVTITPDVVFNSNTSYNVIIVGADQSATCVKNLLSESLAITATWIFTVGEDIYEVPVDAPPVVEPDDDVADSPVAKVLEPRSTSNFAIINTTPSNYGTNLGSINSDDATVTWVDGITVQFNRHVASGVAVSQDWLSLSVEASDGDPSVVASVPSGVLSNTNGDTLTWTPSDTTMWRINNEIIVTVSSDVEDLDGNTLSDDFQFMFTTAYLPLYSTVKKIRTTIGPFIRDINDDVINRNIYLNSIEAYNIANVIYSQDDWDLDSPTFPAQMWVTCKTQHDLLQAKLLDMANEGAGQLKRLGDLTVQEGVDIQKGIQGALQKAIACMDAWFGHILNKNRRATPVVAIKGINNPATPPMRGVRTWNIPDSKHGGIGSNKRLTRKLKSPSPYSKWS